MRVWCRAALASFLAFHPLADPFHGEAAIQRKPGGFQPAFANFSGFFQFTSSNSFQLLRKLKRLFWWHYDTVKITSS